MSLKNTLSHITRTGKKITGRIAGATACLGLELGMQAYDKIQETRGKISTLIDSGAEYLREKNITQVNTILDRFDLPRGIK